MHFILPRPGSVPDQPGEADTARSSCAALSPHTRLGPYEIIAALGAGSGVSRSACTFVVGGWGAGEQTVQYEGRAAELKPPELERYQEIYFKVWPDGPARMNWPGIVYFVVRPTWIRYTDFDQNPPLIREFTFSDGRADPA
jgi:hypothetical protein